jgi:hypothetical protein
MYVQYKFLYLILTRPKLTVHDTDYERWEQGVTKRCRLSWLTNSALVYEPKCGGMGGGAESRPMSTAVHVEPK